MNYRNFTPRCPHGFSRQPLIRCWVCDDPPAGKTAYYLPSEAKHGVINKRGKGRVREQRASGYIAGRARRAGT